MKKVRGSGKINLVSMRNYYDFMRNSFEFVVRGESRNLSKSEINACYEWRIANILIKGTLEPKSFFSYEEWRSFIHSCGIGIGLSNRNIKRVNDRIGELCSDIMTESNNMWKSDEERRRHEEAMERLNKFLSVDVYSANTMHIPHRKIG